jgi:hypothetical protein
MVNSITGLRRHWEHLQSIRDYCRSTLEDRVRLATMAVRHVDRLAIFLVIHQFISMRAEHSRSLRSDNYVRVKDFVCRSNPVSFRWC